MKFWNFFKKQNKPPEDEDENEDKDELLTAITYSIDQSGEIFIDITISSFEDEVIEKLSELVCTISSDKCYIATTQMIKENMEQEGEIEKLEKLLALIIKNKIVIAGQQLLENNDARIESEEPCIQPSDML